MILVSSFSKTVTRLELPFFLFVFYFIYIYIYIAVSVKFLSTTQFHSRVKEKTQLVMDILDVTIKLMFSGSFRNI